MVGGLTFFNILSVMRGNEESIEVNFSDGGTKGPLAWGPKVLSQSSAGARERRAVGPLQISS